MDNSRRITIYTRDRTILTPRQRRRIAHRGRAATATVDRVTRRAGRRYVLRLDRQRRAEIRSFFRGLR